MAKNESPPARGFLKLALLGMGVALLACVGVPLLAVGTEFRTYAILVILFALVLLLSVGRGMTSSGV